MADEYFQQSLELDYKRRDAFVFFECIKFGQYRDERFIPKFNGGKLEPFSFPVTDGLAEYDNAHASSQYVRYRDQS